VDKHHHAAAIQLTGDEDIWNLNINLTVACDLRSAGDQFWNELRKRNYDLLVERPHGSPFALPSVVNQSSEPSGWTLANFEDNMWRSLAGFASHTDNDLNRCYQKPCTNFVDFEWSYAINYATEVDTSLWPVGSNSTHFKEMFEALPYSPNPNDVDLDAWNLAASAVLPLCHSTALKSFSLPEFFPNQVLSGWSSVPVPEDPNCLDEVCSAGGPGSVMV